MAISVKKFVESLSSYSILSAGELSTIRDNLQPELLDKDAEQLARELIKQGKLTKYQAMNIYQGRGKGLVFGEYIVLDKLGAGGMGHVFKAQHRRMKRIVALKVLPPHATTSEKNVKRFYQEVQMAARLTHPNIVTAYDAGDAHGLHFLVMEYVEGQDLSSIVGKQGPLSVQQALNCILQAAKGLEYAHGQGIIHRDIKPANLLLDKQGTLKILDMGLARISNPTTDDSEGGAGELTESGQVMGTADYMAPEQAADTRSADHRADIYSLGCTLYRIITGNTPYQASTTIQKILAHRDQPTPSLKAANSAVSDALERLYQRMMAKEPAQRVQTMSEVVAALEKLHAGNSEEESSIVLCNEQIGDELASFLGSQSAPGSSMIKKAAAAATSEIRKRQPVGEASSGSMSDGVIKPPLWKSPAVLIGGGVGAVVCVALAVFLATRGDDTPMPLEPSPNDVGQTTTTTGSNTASTTTAQATATTTPGATTKPGTSATPGTSKTPGAGQTAGTNTTTSMQAGSYFGGNTTTVKAPPPAQPGKPIDLLVLIDPARDRVLGEWKREGTALVAGSGSDKNAVLAIPCPLPAEYDVRMDVERLMGKSLLSLGMMVGPNRVRGMIDAGLGGEQTAISQVDRQAFLPGAFTESVRLTPGSPHTVTWSVRKDSVRIVIDGQIAAQWQGDPKRLSVPGGTFTVPSDRLFIDLTNSQFRITKLELRTPDDGLQLVKVEPPTPSTTPSSTTSTTPATAGPAVTPPKDLKEPFDLLPLIDTVRHTQHGTWTHEGNRLSVANTSGPWPRALIAYQPPTDYDLHVEADFNGPGAGVGVGVLVEKHKAIVMFSPSGSSISRVDDQHGTRLASVGSVGKVVVGERADILLCVRGPRVAAFFNGQLALDWEGDSSRLSIESAASVPSGNLCLVGSSGTAFSKCEISPPKASLPRYAAVNLVPRFDLTRDAVSGDWRREGQDLVLASTTGGPHTLRLPLTDPRPRRYQITAVVERLPGGGEVAFGVPTGGQRIRVAFDQQGRSSSGLDRLKTKASDDDATQFKQPWLLQPGMPHTIVIRADDGAILATCNGRQIINYTGNASRFSEIGDWGVNDFDQIYFGQFTGPLRLSKLTLAPLDWEPAAEPSTDARAKALDALKLANAVAYGKTSRPDVKALAAEQFRTRAAVGTDEPAMQFVLLQEASRLAAEAGDLELAYAAADDLATLFIVDRRAIEKQLVSESFKNAKTTEAKSALLKDALRLIDRAAHEENFELALDVQSLVAAGAKPVTSDLAKEMKVRGVELAFFKAERDAASPAFAALAEKPDDPAANVAVGRYRCLVLGDWVRGLDNLQQGADLSFKALATLEAEQPTEADKQVALGDRWWELAEAEKPGPLKWAYSERAAIWFRRAWPHAAGVVKTTIEQRAKALDVMHKSSNYAFAGRKPLDAVKIGDRWYKWYADRQTWNDARKICERLGGSLVTLESREKNDALAEFALRHAPNNEEKVSYWIGLSDEETEGTFRWIDGTPLASTTFTKWSGGEPNNGNGREDWVTVEATMSNGNASTYWRDMDTTNFFICEWIH